MVISEIGWRFHLLYYRQNKPRILYFRIHCRLLSWKYLQDRPVAIGERIQCRILRSKDGTYTLIQEDTNTPILIARKESTSQGSLYRIFTSSETPLAKVR
jgi:hypothetical protein